MFWTPRQRLALSLLILLILSYLLILYLNHPARISTPQPSEGPRATELQDQLDPNTATAADLSALPNLGPAMARRIIEDRERFQKDHPSEPAFKKIEDLMRVKGIGPATLENLRPYLRFPRTQPAP
jgi:competence protein ComEA